MGEAAASGAGKPGQGQAGGRPGGSLVRGARYRCGVAPMGVVEWMPVLGPRVGILVNAQQHQHRQQ